MKERNLQSTVLKNAQVLLGTSAIEIKAVKGLSIPFATLKDHQERALLLTQSKRGIAWKIPDCGFQNPFDCFILKNTPAYVAVVFNTGKRGKKECWLIPIQKWVAARNKGNRKSLTLETARKIGVELLF